VTKRTTAVAPKADTHCWWLASSRWWRDVRSRCALPTACPSWWRWRDDVIDSLKYVPEISGAGVLWARGKKWGTARPHEFKIFEFAFSGLRCGSVQNPKPYRSSGGARPPVRWRVCAPVCDACRRRRDASVVADSRCVTWCAPALGWLMRLLWDRLLI